MYFIVGNVKSVTDPSTIYYRVLEIETRKTKDISYDSLLQFIASGVLTIENAYITDIGDKQKIELIGGDLDRYGVLEFGNDNASITPVPVLVGLIHTNKQLSGYRIANTDGTMYDYNLVDVQEILANHSFANAVARFDEEHNIYVLKFDGNIPVYDVVENGFQLVGRITHFKPPVKVEENSTSDESMPDNNKEANTVKDTSTDDEEAQIPKGGAENNVIPDNSVSTNEETAVSSEAEVPDNSAEVLEAAVSEAEVPDNTVVSSEAEVLDNTVSEAEVSEAEVPDNTVVSSEAEVLDNTVPEAAVSEAEVPDNTVVSSEAEVSNNEVLSEGEANDEKLNNGVSSEAEASVNYEEAITLVEEAFESNEEKNTSETSEESADIEIADAFAVHSELPESVKDEVEDVTEASQETEKTGIYVTGSSSSFEQMKELVHNRDSIENEVSLMSQMVNKSHEFNSVADGINVSPVSATAKIKQNENNTEDTPVKAVTSTGVSAPVFDIPDTNTEISEVKDTATSENVTNEVDKTSNTTQESVDNSGVMQEDTLSKEAYFKSTSEEVLTSNEISDTLARIERDVEADGRAYTEMIQAKIAAAHAEEDELAKKEALKESYPEETDWVLRFKDGTTTFGGIEIFEEAGIMGISCVGSVVMGKDVEGKQILVEMTVPKGITGIAESTFQGFTNLVKVVLPEDFETINNWAFMDCTSLETVEGEIAEIEEAAFCNCTSLREINLSSTGVIDKAAFMFCESLSEGIELKSIERIGSHAFAYSGVTGVSIGKNIRHCGGFVFSSCYALEEVVFAGKSEFKAICDRGFADFDRWLKFRIGDISKLPCVGMFFRCNRLETTNLDKALIEEYSLFLFKESGIK